MTKFNLALAGILALAQASAMAATLVDGGFETKGAALPVNAYCYNGTLTAGGPACAASPWGGGVNVGVIRSLNGSWGSVAAASGNYYGFVQTVSTITQQFTAMASGSGVLSWVDTNRPQLGLQSYVVSIFDGANAVTIGSFVTAVGPWVARTSSSFALVNGTTYTLRFTGQSVPDATAFIDDVSLATIDVPEPASWAMMIAGFGLVGAASRRRRLTVAA